MLRHALLPILLFITLLPTEGIPDALRIPPVQKPADWVKMPGNGMTMEKVEKWFGSPMKKYQSVGNPPITRWDYPDYSVYFEGDQVITSVYRPDTR